MNTEKLKGLQISPAEKSRPQRAFWSIVIVVAAVLLVLMLFVFPQTGNGVPSYIPH